MSRLGPYPASDREGRRDPAHRLHPRHAAPPRTKRPRASPRGETLRSSDSAAIAATRPRFESVGSVATTCPPSAHVRARRCRCRARSRAHQVAEPRGLTRHARVDSPVHERRHRARNWRRIAPERHRRLPCLLLLDAVPAIRSTSRTRQRPSRAMQSVAPGRRRRFTAMIARDRERDDLDRAHVANLRHRAPSCRALRNRSAIASPRSAPTPYTTGAARRSPVRRTTMPVCRVERAVQAPHAHRAQEALGREQREREHEGALLVARPRHVRSRQEGLGTSRGPGVGRCAGARWSWLGCLHGNRATRPAVPWHSGQRATAALTLPFARKRTIRSGSSPLPSHVVHIDSVPARSLPST